MKKEIDCCIVTFNPNIERLNRSLLTIHKQVKDIFIVDNNSENINEIIKLSQKFKNIRLIKLRKNFGIAYALNVSFNKLKISTNIKWLLTLDQDSVLPNNYVEKMFSYDIPEKTAVICSTPIDYRRYYKKKVFHGLIEKGRAIQAGSFYNIDIMKKIGSFDSCLFIDYVDFEYCLRAKKNNYRIFLVGDVFFEQEFGNIRYSKINIFWNLMFKIFKLPIFKKASYYSVYKKDRFFYTLNCQIKCNTLLK